MERSVIRTSAGGQGQVATDAELQCLKVARLLRDVCLLSSSTKRNREEEFEHRLKVAHEEG